MALQTLKSGIRFRSNTFSFDLINIFADASIFFDSPKSFFHLLNFLNERLIREHKKT